MNNNTTATTTTTINTSSTIPIPISIILEKETQLVQERQYSNSLLKKIQQLEKELTLLQNECEDKIDVYKKDLDTENKKNERLIQQQNKMLQYQQQQLLETSQQQQYQLQQYQQQQQQQQYQQHSAISNEEKQKIEDEIRFNIEKDVNLNLSRISDKFFLKKVIFESDTLEECYTKISQGILHLKETTILDKLNMIPVSVRGYRELKNYCLICGKASHTHIGCREDIQTLKVDKFGVPVDNSPIKSPSSSSSKSRYRKKKRDDDSYYNGGSSNNGDKNNSTDNELESDDDDYGLYETEYVYRNDSDGNHQLISSYKRLRSSSDD